MRFVEVTALFSLVRDALLKLFDYGYSCWFSKVFKYVSEYLIKKSIEVRIKILKETI